MIELVHSMSIARPVSEVFAYVGDVGNLPLWAEVAKSAEPMGDGDVKVGTRSRVEIDFHGHRSVATYIVTRYEQDRLFAFRTSDAPFDLENSYEFTPVDGGTHLDITSAGDAHGFSRLLEPLVAKMLDRQFVADHERLRELLNRGGGA